MIENTKQSPLISVIVPVYNTRNYIDRCIASIAAQTYENIEIVVVDDGSTDGSKEACDSLISVYSNVFVFHKTNGGLSSARNYGIENAHGDYIAFVDSDDWIEPEMYKTLYDSMIKSKCRIACCGRYDVSEPTGERKIGLCPNKNETITSVECAKKIFVWDGIDSSACDKLFDIHIFDDFRFPEKMLSEDVAIMYKIILNEDNVCLINKPFYNYYHRSESITTSTFRKEKLHIDQHSKNILDYVSRYYPELVESAQFFRAKEIIYLYDLIVQNDQENEYRDELRLYSKEILKYYKVLNKYDDNMKRLRCRLTLLSMINPILYIFYLKITGNISMVVHKLKKRT